MAKIVPREIDRGVYPIKLLLHNVNEIHVSLFLLKCYLSSLPPAEDSTKEATTVLVFGSYKYSQHPKSGTSGFIRFNSCPIVEWSGFRAIRKPDK